MLLTTEIYGIWALAALTWFSWSRPAVSTPPSTPGHVIDVYVCTYDEPTEVVAATLAGCRALAYPHTTYLLDDGRRREMRELAELAGARYLTRPDNSHAKAGNINAALPRTEGDLVLMLDADHVPMPDALDAMVGYFDDERGRPRPESPRLLQPRLGPALRGRPPRAVALLPGRESRQEPPRGRLLVRLGRLDPPRGAARDRRRRHRDDRRGLPHDDPHAALRLGDPLPRRGPRPGAGAARPRRIPAAARPLGARQPGRIHAAGVAAQGARAEAGSSASPTSPAWPPTLRRRCGSCSCSPSRWCCGPAHCR